MHWICQNHRWYSLRSIILKNCKLCTSKMHLFENWLSTMTSRLMFQNYCELTVSLHSGKWLISMIHFHMWVISDVHHSRWRKTCHLYSVHRERLVCQKALKSHNTICSLQMFSICEFVILWTLESISWKINYNLIAANVRTTAEMISLATGLWWEFCHGFMHMEWWYWW